MAQLIKTIVDTQKPSYKPVGKYREGVTEILAKLEKN